MPTSGDTKDGFKLVRKLPHVRTPDGAIAPRVVALAAGYLSTSGYDFSENALVAYVQAFQQNTAAEDGRTVGAGSSAEAGAAGRDRRPRIQSDGRPRAAPTVPAFVCAACAISATLHGRNVLEPMVLFDRILRQDPAGAYARMDFESRDLYRTEIANIAEYSDLTEGEVAAAALALARSAHQETHASPRAGGPPGACWILPSGGRLQRPAPEESASALRWASGSHLSCGGIRTSFICRAPKCSPSPSCRRSCCC